jgi:hypothetical protein
LERSLVPLTELASAHQKVSPSPSEVQWGFALAAAWVETLAMMLLAVQKGKVWGWV